jgi:hypothetical protein
MVSRADQLRAKGRFQRRTIRNALGGNDFGLAYSGSNIGEDICVIVHPLLPFSLHFLFGGLPRVRIGFFPFGYYRCWGEIRHKKFLHISRLLRFVRIERLYVLWITACRK